MIVFILAISALCLFISYIYVNQTGSRMITVGLSLIFLIGSLALISLNDNNNYGMKRQTFTKTTTIKSALSPQIKVLIEQPVGTSGKESVIAYKTADTQKKPKTTQKDSITTNHLVSTTATEATLTTKTSEWVYKNGWYEFLFGIADNNHEVIKRTNTFALPSGWNHMTQTQLKAFLKQAKVAKTDPTAKATGEEYVTAKVKAAMIANPTMSASEQATTTKQATAEYQAVAMQKLITQIKTTVK